MNRCQAKNAGGEQCRSPLVGDTGYCYAHTPENEERIRAARQKGGEATRTAWQAPGFAPDELPPLVNVEDAQRRIDVVGRAAAEGKITEKMCDSLTRNAAEWIKGASAKNSERLVNEIQRELEKKDATIAELRTENRELRRQLDLKPGRKLQAVQ